MDPEEQDPPSRLKLVLFTIVILHASLPLMWLRLVATDGPTASDWSFFQRVGQAFVAGDWGLLYASQGQWEGWLWLYPPYALYLVAPLGWMSPGAAYGLLAGLGVLALVAALVLLARLAPPGRGAVLWFPAVLLCAPAYTNLVAGQNAALLTLCVVVAATLHTSAIQGTQARETLGWATLGLLALKPNWGLFMGLYALSRGAWRGAATMIGVVLALCLASLPLGLDLWADFVRVSTQNHALFSGYDAFRLITLKGFLGSLLGQGALGVGLWAVLAAGLVAAAVVIWRAPGTPLEHLAAAVLLAVSANPYASFYDALVLVIPAAVWWSHRERWRPGAWWCVGAVIAALWGWEHLAHSWLPMGDAYYVPFSLVGPGTSVWLVIAAVEARRATPEASRERSEPGEPAAA